MKKYFFGWTAGAAIVMLLLPYLAVAFAPADAGMAVCFLLFYAVNPVYAIAAGAAAGRCAKCLWGLPVLCAAFFLLGAWALFTPSEVLFAVYAGVYLALGLAAMLLSRFLARRKGR